MPMSRDDLADVLRRAKQRSKNVTVVLAVTALSEIHHLVALLSEEVISSPEAQAIRLANRDRSLRPLPGGKVTIGLGTRFDEATIRRIVGKFAAHTHSAALEIA